MNKNNLKSYAPQARKDFIAAVTARAQQLGITALQMLPATVSGDVAIIDGTTWPAKVARQREALHQRIQRHGFAQTMEEVAYTWFNRFAALRYMELHDFLDHGHRVLSSRDGGLPELLRHAAEVTLPGLNPAKVQELQLAGNRDDELFKQLLVAQCNELSRTMPFLFERIDDDTELLLPDNLLRTDSIVAKLVAGVPEADWQEIEVIGWLYQFYISEKKDQVIGKVVKSEDIPAATQLFTPNWIVQYLVQNSVGRLWLMANPGSTLASEWPYYIQPAEQTPEVQAQLDALIQTRIREDGDTLNPESITVLDPACGSGHILVVAYDVLKAIYLERGYRLRDIPRLILEKNLYGLDIDDRAAQMAGFALLMKARADDRRLLNDADNPPRLNVLSLQDSKGLKLEDLATPLAPYGVQRATVWALIEAFEHAKTFGSLIQIPYQLKTQLPPLAQVLAMVAEQGDLYAQQAAKDLLPLVQQAQILAMQFDAVVANPPYMGGNYLNPSLKIFAAENFPDAKSDLFSISSCRFFGLSKLSGFLGLMTPFTWMFLKSYENFRSILLRNKTVNSLIQPEYHAIWSSAAVPICAFVVQNSFVDDYLASFIRLTDFYGEEIQPVKALEAIRDPFCKWMYEACPVNFRKLPGSPFAYWIKNTSPFDGPRVGDNFESGGRTKTHGNELYLRYWWEISSPSTKWTPYANGGDYRKYAGNDLQVVNWSETAINYYNSHGGLPPRKFWNKEGITWGLITSARSSFRLKPAEFQYSSGAPTVFNNKFECDYVLLGFLNSPLAYMYLKALNPTLNTTVGDVLGLPLPDSDLLVGVGDKIKKVADVTKLDWDCFEVSRGFCCPPIFNYQNNKIIDSYGAWIDDNIKKINLVKGLEEESFRAFIDYYHLDADVSWEVPLDQVCLTVNPSFRYAIKSLDDDAWDRFKKDSSAELVSFIFGCMMGRYSLDEPGLIYAHAGNVGFDPSRYTRFPADADGIVPITDEHWFDDDAPERVREFLQAVWGPDTLAENMAWLAESLGAKASETPAETIRRYIADKFYKDHLQTYKKRPIYWLFSSGKQGAFQALVYLHRYHEGTLARMRAEYVIPLSAKMAARLEILEQDANAASSAAARTKIRKQIESLRKKQTELLAFDEKLRHYADMRISLDLDDGVKVNYGKFGDLLDSVKVVTGGAGDE
jgi:hypothetical protein